MKGSQFTLLFEQSAMMLLREMQVLAACRTPVIVEIMSKALQNAVTPLLNSESV